MTQGYAEQLPYPDFYRLHKKNPNAGFWIYYRQRREAVLKNKRSFFNLNKITAALTAASMLVSIAALIEIGRASCRERV